MAGKSALINEILNELRRAQTAEWKPPKSGPVMRLDLPPSLPAGNGRQLPATEALLEAVSSYAKLCLDNDSALKPRFKIVEFADLVRQAFGNVLREVDLAAANEELVADVGTEIDRLLSEWTDPEGRSGDLTLGCQLLKGDEAYPVRVGPVLFETRQDWLRRSVDSGLLSAVTARRLEADRQGKRRQKRRPSAEAHNEQAVRDALEEFPIVCTVETDGLSGKYVQEKGLLAARLAMMAVALLWSHPSNALRWMSLAYDRRVFQRHTVVFGKGRVVGSNSEISQLPDGRWTNSELIAELRSFQWLLDQAGEALATYVQPVRPVVRPKIMNSLFLSLWWFHEACREPLDQIATTKFAASMDALVQGQSAVDIMKFIRARLGHGPDDPIMTDGRTTKEAIDKIYSASRSRLIHGNSTDFAHDWSQVRSTAEAIGRSCLVAASDWLSANPGVDDLAALSRS